MPDGPKTIEKSVATDPIAAFRDVQDMQRRLVICLDGTWNARDSGTNIYHLANLIREGIVEGGDWVQMVYYDPGVGTGVLDSVTGGAFGIGLSKNVREAYDWLVEKYRAGDEVYIFGFSRGAFTARWLAGLIAKCGLLYRGAPMPPSELWNAYRLLGRYPNPATRSQPPKYWWERIFGQKRPPFRRISELRADDWPGGEGGLAPDALPPNESERLLCQWSRRIPITCLGVFDTVGSLGVDALAIPWLSERTAQFHDTQLSSIIRHGFQALAIDEHRANFAHIPWHRPVASPAPQPETIQQRWFIGAHSNIGGSYEDDLLAQYPLAWMMQNCRALGLEFRPPKSAAAPDPSQPPPAGACLPLLRTITDKTRPDVAKPCPRVRDSFSELGHGLWSGLIRSKRDYRTIQPNEEFQNSILVKSANERIDESVWSLLKLENSEPLPPAPRYHPPNLWRVAREKFPDLPRPTHRYLEDASAWRWFIAWLVCVGLVGGAIAYLCDRRHAWWIISGVMLAAVVVDWSESFFNFHATLEPDGFRAERRKAFASFCLFLRLILLSAIAAAIVFWLVKIWPWIFQHDQDWHVLWLVGFNVMILYCIATAAWCAAPMWSAGYGEMVPLQFACTPTRVLAVLKKWTSSTKAPENDQQVLMPIAHALWRDMLGYIPAYTSLIFFGTWFALSVGAQQFLGYGVPVRSHWLFSLDPFSWQVAGAIALIYALADYTEDTIHLSHLRRYPKPPSGILVALGFSATLLKSAFAFIGLMGVIMGMGWLALDQGRRVHLSFTAPHSNGASGGLCALVILLSVLLLLPPIFDASAYLKKRLVRAK